VTAPASRMTVVPSPPDPVALAERVAAAVAAHPAVAGLHGGIYGSVTTYLPGRKLLGVRIGEGDEPVEIAVVVHADRPIPEVVRSLRSQVSRLCGGAAVDITIADIVLPGELP
jgi:hypothetical protein